MGAKRDRRRAQAHRIAVQSTGVRIAPLEVRLDRPLHGRTVIDKPAMRWSVARAAIITGPDVVFRILERAGSKRVIPKAPSWYRVVKTPQTVYQDKAKSNEKDRRNY